MGKIYCMMGKSSTGKDTLYWFNIRPVVPVAMTVFRDRIPL